MLKITIVAAISAALAGSAAGELAFVRTPALVLRNCPQAACPEIARYPYGTEVRVVSGVAGSTWVLVSIPLRNPTLKIDYPSEVRGYMNGMYLDSFSE